MEAGVEMLPQSAFVAQLTAFKYTPEQVERESSNALELILLVFCCCPFQEVSKFKMIFGFRCDLILSGSKN